MRETHNGACVCVWRCTKSSRQLLCEDSLFVVSIKRVFEPPHFISSDPERCWQGCRQARATGNNAVVRWCYKEDSKMLMTTDRQCVHTHCNHIIVPTGQLVTLLWWVVVFPPCVDEVLYIQYPISTATSGHTITLVTSSGVMACCFLLRRSAPRWWSSSSDKGAIG